MAHERPDPGALLKQVQEQERSAHRGKLRIFFGAAPGVGKTYAMLQAARRLFAEGVDVVIGLVETHGRRETEALLLGLDLLPQREIEYRGAKLREFDLDAALARKPEIIVLDELAHTNVAAAKSRNVKRWQDVKTLLDAGISVFTTVNVQHIESLNDIIAQITGVSVRETIPDSVLEEADEIELIDIPPDALLERLREGKVYVPESIQHAQSSFFRKGNLIALRELALRRTAEWVDAEVESYKREHGVSKIWPVSERILVAIGPSPTSADVIRAAKRMAVGLRAGLIAVYVETSASDQLSEGAKDRVVRNMRLAESLKAETVTIAGSNVSRELINYARLRNVSKIVIGKPMIPKWRRFLGSPVDELIRHSGEIDVFVMKGETASFAPLIPRKPNQPVKWFSYFLAIAIVAACTAIAAVMFGTGRIDKTNIAMVYLLGVVLSATRLGKWPSALTAVLSVAAFDFFFVPPEWTFAVSDAQYIITFAVMLAVGLLISALTNRIRDQASTAMERERRTAAIYSMSRELAAAKTLEEIVPIGTRHIRETFDVGAAVLLPVESGLRVADDPAACTIDDSDIGVAQWAFDHGSPAGLATNTLPASKILAIPLWASQGKVGALCIKPHETEMNLSATRFHLLETFANQLGLAIERGRLIEETQNARVQAETERLRNALLSSVSHDLRTPLAVIAGAASGLLDHSEREGSQSDRETAETIYREARHLNDLIDNLIFATRLESGQVEVNRDWVSIEEVIGSAIARVRDRLADHPLQTNVPSDLPLIRVDGVLIEQVVLNLLDNALKHTPAGTPLEINAWTTEKALVTEVADAGPGLPRGEERRVFDRFHRAKNALSSGLGLGLAICRGIVAAHGGRIWAEPRQPHGASFRFSLPLATAQPPIEFDPSASAVAPSTRGR